MNDQAGKPGERLPVEGTFNVRDLGGYPAANGRSVRQGRIFRSDDLSKLTEDGLEFLNRLGIRSIVDFRERDEREYAPDKHPASVDRVHEFPIRVGNLMELLELNGHDGSAAQRQQKLRTRFQCRIRRVFRSPGRCGIRAAAVSLFGGEGPGRVRRRHVSFVARS